MWKVPIGPIDLVDGGANSRQFLLDRHPEVPVLKSALWAFPYVLRPQSENTLLIGPGGGIDILIGKAFGVRQIRCDGKRSRYGAPFGGGDQRIRNGRVYEMVSVRMILQK